MFLRKDPTVSMRSFTTKIQTQLKNLIVYPIKIPFCLSPCHWSYISPPYPIKKHLINWIGPLSFLRRQKQAVKGVYSKHIMMKKHPKKTSVENFFMIWFQEEIITTSAKITKLVHQLHQTQPQLEEEHEKKTHPWRQEPIPAYIHLTLAPFCQSILNTNRE